MVQFDAINMNSEWQDLIYDLSKNSMSIAYGLFSLSGKLLEANKTMCHILDTNAEAISPKNQFINPDFEKIASFESTSELIFEGVLTIGNYVDKNYVLNARIFNRNNTYFVFAEADILHLFEENRKMSRLNQEVNNLQRLLIKEKRTLQQTLVKLKDTQEMLIHSEKMNALGQMIAGVAHEINNPISFVTNNLYELEKHATDFIGAYEELELEIKKNASQKIKDFAKNIREKTEIDYLTEDISEIIGESKSGVERVKNIIEDLRRFSRLDESNIKRIDLIENIRSTLTIVQSELLKKNIQFKVDAPEELLIDCFPGQLNQAILNILINAIQAVRTEGKISLVIKEEEKNIVIHVEDNGIGMKKENMTKIFDPFYTTKPIGTGTGLGLSISYKIIHNLHKGKIEVESEIDKGTIIKVIIPKEINI